MRKRPAVLALELSGQQLAYSKYVLCTAFSISTGLGGNSDKIGPHSISCQAFKPLQDDPPSPSSATNYAMSAAFASLSQVQRHHI